MKTKTEHLYKNQIKALFYYPSDSFLPEKDRGMIVLFIGFF